MRPPQATATHRDTLSHGEVGAVADPLNVKREEVIET